MSQVHQKKAFDNIVDKFQILMNGGCAYTFFQSFIKAKKRDDIIYVTQENTKFIILIINKNSDFLFKNFASVNPNLMGRQKLTETYSHSVLEFCDIMPKSIVFI